MNCAVGGPLPYLAILILFLPSHNDVDDDDNYDDVNDKNYNDDDDDIYNAVDVNDDDNVRRQRQQRL